jgi:hypothetical protein
LLTDADREALTEPPGQVGLGEGLAALARTLTVLAWPPLMVIRKSVVADPDQVLVQVASLYTAVARSVTSQ